MFKTYPAPHLRESVPKNCWTCKRHTLVLSGITTCEQIPTYNHAKMGIDPCERYELNEVWLNVDWGYARSGSE